MHKGFLGETKNVKVRLPVGDFKRVEKLTGEGVSINTAIRTLLINGLTAVGKNKRDFQKLCFKEKEKLKAKII